MKIIGSEFSPFVRIARAVSYVLEFQYDLVDTGSFVNMAPENKAMIDAHNPLIKVPILIDEKKLILDSRVIVSYLINKAAKEFDGISFGFPLAYEEENLITVIYGMTDAGVLRFILGSTSALPLDEGYMLRSLDRIKGGFNYLENNEHLGASFGLPELCLICMLEWFDKRSVCEWSEYKRINAIYSKFSGEDCLVKSRIPD